MANFSLRRRLGFLLGLIFLALCGTLAALGEENIPLHEIGIRYQPLGGEVCLTRESLSEEGLSLLAVDEETLLDAMVRDEIYLICITPEGRQVSLRRRDKPTAISAGDAFQMQMGDKDQFLTLLARAGRYASASWSEAADGFALFSTHQVGTEGADAAIHTLSLSTLYLNRIYAFETDVIGRVPEEEDAALLISTANRTLFLGAAETAEEASQEPAELRLPELPTLTEETAVFTESLGGVSLSLSPIPSVIGTTSITLTGKTQPDATLRYVVGGASSSRFRPEADGTFSVTMKGLTAGEINEITVNAFTKSESSSISFPLMIDWQSTPLALAQESGEVMGDRFEVSGLTLPGATVQVIRKQGKETVAVQEDGSFTVSLPAGKATEIKFTVRALANGYRRTDQDVVLTRKVSTEEELQALRRKLKTVSYEKLLEKPGSHAGKVVEYAGQVVSLANIKGSPRFLLEIDEGQRIICLCENLLELEIGQELRILGTLLGENLEIESASAVGDYPALELAMIVS